MILNQRLYIPLAVIFVVAVYSLLSLYFINMNRDELNNQVSELEPIVSDNVDDLNTNSLSASSLNARSNRVISQIIPYAEYQSSFGPLTKSLIDTYIPIHLVVNPDGQLVITTSIKTLIEYFLSANTEESIEVIKGRIEEVFDRHLIEPANSQAKAVLAQYFDYKQVLIDIESELALNQTQANQGIDYQTVLAERREARISHLDQAVYDAFYLKEDSQDNYTAAMLELNRNKELSAEEKQQQGIELISLLPREEQVHKMNENQRNTLQQEVSAARNIGASDEDIYQMRTQVYDENTAERLAIRDEEIQEWYRRFSQYRQQRQKIMDSEGLTQSDKQQEIMILQKDLFTSNEQRRLPTLDRMEDNSL